VVDSQEDLLSYAPRVSLHLNVILSRRRRICFFSAVGMRDASRSLSWALSKGSAWHPC